MLTVLTLVQELFPSCFCLFGEGDPILDDKKLSLIWVNSNLPPWHVNASKFSPPPVTVSGLKDS